MFIVPNYLFMLLLLMYSSHNVHKMSELGEIMYVSLPVSSWKLLCGFWLVAVAGFSLRPGFNPKAVHVGYVVDKVALSHLFL
jgi:hypothetical protein